MNSHFRDASLFFKITSGSLRTKMDRTSVIKAALHFSVGVEHALKGILWDVNPIYVYKEQEFKHTAPILYSDDIVTTIKDEVAKEPKRDVITFRLALARAKLFSPTVLRHVSVLFKLASIRDSICHGPIEGFGVADTSILLRVTFYFFVDELRKEKGFTRRDLFGSMSKEMKKIAISAGKEKNAKKQLDELFDLQKRYWDEIRKSEEKILYARENTDITLSRESNYWRTTEVQCPACANPSVLTGEVMRVIIDGKIIVDTAFPKKLNCHYCNLSISGAIEMDVLAERFPDIKAAFNDRAQ